MSTPKECPNCGSKNITESIDDEFDLGYPPMGMIKTYWECEDCGAIGELK